MERKKEWTRRALAFVLAWLLCLMCVTLGLVAVVRLSLCSADFFKEQAADSGYAAAAAEELAETFQSYGAGAGVGADAMRALADADEIEADLLAAVDALYTGAESGFSADAWTQRADEALLAYAEEEGYRIDEAASEGLYALAELCASDYAAVATLPLLSYLRPLIVQCRQSMTWMLLAPAVAALAAAALLFVISGRRGFFARLTQALTGAAALTAGLNLWGLLVLPEGELALNPVSLRLLVTEYASSVVNMVWICAAVYAVLAAVLYAAYRLAGRRGA